MYANFMSGKTSESFEGYLEVRDRKSTDFELLEKIRQAQERDYAYDALKVNPYQIRDGDRLLKIKLMERLTLEEMGYTNQGTLQQVAKGLSS